MTLLLGCIADDITGASDLGLMLSSHGMPATLFLGVPRDQRHVNTPAAVIALKTRTAPVDEAVTESLAAAKWLLANGSKQLFFKYCSTFDSTDRGNIGPVTDALLGYLDDDFTVLLPAFPDNGRTVVNGELQVNGVPLAESPMRNHPLTPMRESSLVTLMDRQTVSGRTASIGHDVVLSGSDAIRSALDDARRSGHRYASIDAVTKDDLAQIAPAISDLRLITGGSGIAAAIPATLGAGEDEISDWNATVLPRLDGHAAVLAGSCSEATRNQVGKFAKRATVVEVDPIRLHCGETDTNKLADLAVDAASAGDVLVVSSAGPGELKSVQDVIGPDASAALVEDAIAKIAGRLHSAGVRKFVVAGGETSGAVAQALDLDEMLVSDEIDPGVPWMTSVGSDPLCIAFKSGNFGAPDFFEKALGMLP